MNTITKLFITAVALFSFSLASAQSFLWGIHNGGEGEDVVKALAVDGNGATYLTGFFTDISVFGSESNETTLTSNGIYDAFVSKTSADGDLVWVKSFGGAGNEYGTSVTTDAEGNVYLCGVFEESFDANPGNEAYTLTSAGGLDIFIIKLDANGVFVWAKSVGGAGYEETTGMGIDGQGNIYVTGYFYDVANFNQEGSGSVLTPYGSCDGFILKYAADGSFTLAKQFGGTDIDLPLALKVMDNGDMYLTGEFRETADFNPNPEQSFTLATQPDFRAVFLMHLDSSGNLIEAVNVGESESEAVGRDLDIDSEGNAYIAGHYGGPMTFNLNGQNEINLDSGSFTEGFIAKVNFTAGTLWAKTMDTEAASFALSVAVNSADEIFVSGFFGETITLDELTLTRESLNSDDDFLAKLNSQGDFLSAFVYGGVNFIDSQHIKIDAADHIYISGSFETTADLNPLPAVSLNTQSNGFRDIYTIKMNSRTLGLNNYDMAKYVVYPNPVTNNVYVQSTDNFAGSNYKVFDTLGRIINKGQVSYGNAIELSALDSGVYLIEINNQFKFKIVKN